VENVTERSILQESYIHSRLCQPNNSKHYNMWNGKRTKRDSRIWKRNRELAA